MKILVGLIEHFGDVVACEPVARYLHNKYPNSHVSWAIREGYRELVDVNPHINETIVVGCLTDWIKMRKHNGSQYDLMVDLHVNFRVCEECRIPLIKDQGNPFVNAYEWFDHGALLEAFCEGAGLPKLSAQPQIYLQDEHKAAVDKLQLPAGYCVIHRESNDPAKDWTDEQWLSLVRFLVNDLKIAVVEVGTKKQKKVDASHTNGKANAKSERNPVKGQFESLVINLLNRTTLMQTAEVIRRARFYIGIDSGPAHLANAVKTPGIVLLGRMGFFRQYMPYTGFYASRSPFVRIVRNLSGAVAEIKAEEVIEATRYLVHTLDQPSAQAIIHSNGSSPIGGAAMLDPAYKNKVTESGFFDPAWYVTHVPEVMKEGIDPLDHFLTIGERSSYSPGAGFNAEWYKSQRPDLAAVSEPLRHYLYCGRYEGLSPCPQNGYAVTEEPPPTGHVASTLASLSSELETANGSHAANGDVLPRIFAFYLPQFHPIAENNYGHRPGFTEWDNVIKCEPLFNGHYQPRIPGELGYYDLRSLDVMREQVKLANDHGIAGFCFYYYYFQGKKLLYKPIDNYIKSDIKAPFLFLWANENWTRRWDGGDNEVLISQKHSPEDDLAFIRELLPIFSDDRYVKVKGKPVLGVYKTHLFPDILRSSEVWRDEARQYGFPDLYLVMVDDWTDSPRHPRELGFDASYEIPSNIVPDGVLWQQPEQLGLKDDFQGRIVDYRKFASFHMGRPFPDYKRFRTVMAPWDNSPRYGSRAMVHVNTDNDAYRLWLSEALIDTKRRYQPEERIVFLHSWNEWCEGTYVEPDGRHGRHLLEETKAAVDELRSLAVLDENEDHLKMATYLRRLMREKDEGASRSLQAMRQQTMHMYQIARAHEAAEATLQGVVQSKSWRLTVPLRALARLLKKG